MAGVGRSMKCATKSTYLLVVYTGELTTPSLPCPTSPALTASSPSGAEHPSSLGGGAYVVLAELVMAIDQRPQMAPSGHTVAEDFKLAIWILSLDSGGEWRKGPECRVGDIWASEKYVVMGVPRISPPPVCSVLSTVNDNVVCVIVNDADETVDGSVDVKAQHFLAIDVERKDRGGCSAVRRYQASRLHPDGGVEPIP
uniref:DUF1618 domain-containing protein n=1 Tax=Oryza meridionalis TaxID=40149 RepID=A0A0E0CXZ7_9ORYZ